MKKRISEINELPHIFEYLEFVKNKKTRKSTDKITYLNTCNKYQTDFYTFGKPEKKLVRFI
jgi:hypothetical protein